MKKRGFTLIELLVVVAVLALLASIVFSNLGGAREGARISNALSFQSQTHSLLGSDLVGWWNFNEGSGTAAGDISGYDNHGTIYGATHVDGVPGTGGSALSFDGVNDYVGLISNLNIDSAISYSIWIYPTSNPYTAYGGILTTENHSLNTGMSLWFKSNRIYYGESHNSRQYTDNITRNLNEWYHVLVSYSDDTYTLYVNGIKTDSRGGISTTLATEAIIGRLLVGYGSYYFVGSIDDVRIYSRALTASEVQGLYAQTKGNYVAK